MGKVDPKWNSQWHVIVAKFASKCSFSGEGIYKGEKVLFKPSTREVVSYRSGKFADISHEEKWSERFVNEINVYNMALEADKEWVLSKNRTSLYEGTEMECLKYYHTLEIHSFTGYGKQFGYSLTTAEEFYSPRP